MNKTVLYVLIPLIILVGVFIAFKTTVNTNPTEANLTWGKISSQQLQQEMNSEDLIIVDLREPELYTQGHIPNAVNIPFDTIQTKYQDLDKNKKIVFVCHMGPMGEASSQLIMQAGYQKVANLQGGMAAWDGPIE